MCNHGNVPPVSRQRKEEPVKESHLREHIRVRRREGYAAAEQRLASRATTLCYVDENEMIGKTKWDNWTNLINQKIPTWGLCF